MTVKMRAIKADITLLDVDAIVNAANTTLLGGGGIDVPVPQWIAFRPLSRTRSVPIMDAPLTANTDIPKSTRLAALLLWISAAVATLATIAGWLRLLPSTGNIFISAVTIALLAVPAWQIPRRQNWARWLFTLVTVLGTVMVAINLIVNFRSFLGLPLTTTVVGIIQIALQLTALVLLFWNDPRAWFAKSLS